jgi:uncharacterized membrane protein
MPRMTVAGALWVGISLCLLGLPLAAAVAVNGRVVDQNGKGVPGATVEIGGKREKTDQGGNFTIDGLEEGESYTANVRKGDSQGGGTVRVSKGRLTPDIKITIKAKAEVFTGKVVDRDGAGQPSATVTIQDCGTTKTNSKGQFTIECEPGSYQARVTTVDDKSAQKNVTLQSGRVSPEIEVQ